MSANSTYNVPTTDLLTFAFDSNPSQDENKPVYVDVKNPSRCITAFETRVLVRKFIAGLKAAGFQKGDCVVVVLGNNFLYSTVFFSIIGAGGIYLGANPVLQANELEHMIHLGEPKFIVTSSDILPNVMKAPSAQSLRPDQILILDHDTFPLATASRLPASPPPEKVEESSEVEPKKWTDIVTLAQHGESDWYRFDDEETARTTTAAMFSTSGTSGLPKGAVLSHYALICQNLSLETVPPYEVRRLVSLPFFHGFAALFVHVMPVRLGQPLYVMPRYQMEDFVAAVYKYQITDTLMAPPIVHAFNKSPVNLKDKMESLHWIGVGGAPIDSQALHKFHDHLHATTTLSQVWGMTEIGAAMLVRYPEYACDGSIGRPLAGYEMRLIDANEQVVTEDNVSGELQVRYPGMMSGYKGQEVQPRGAWYPTGDIMCTINGRYYVTGRSKELIKVNGWQVAPAELESLILTYPGVQDAGVIGVTLEGAVSELPRAYVVLKTDEDGRQAEITSEEIYNFCKSRLASYKALKGGVVFVDAIPRTASGKVQRFKLKQMDQLRRSVTEMLLNNTNNIVTHQKDEVLDIKEQTAGLSILTAAA